MRFAAVSFATPSNIRVSDENFYAKTMREQFLQDVVEMLKTKERGPQES